MIGRQRAVTRRKRRAALVRQLLGMELDRQAEIARHVEHTRHLLRAETDILAKAVDRIDQALGRRFPERRQAHFIEIGVGADIFWKSVRAEECRADADRAMVLNVARDAQHAKLGIAVEAIARLDLDRRHAFGDQAIDTFERAGEKLLRRRRARRRDGRKYPAARAHDRLVRCALLAQFELARARSCVDQVGMTIDQPGRDEAAAERLAPRIGEPGGNADGIADKRDSPIVDADCRGARISATCVARVRGDQRTSQEQLGQAISLRQRIGRPGATSIARAATEGTAKPVRSMSARCRSAYR